MEAAQEAHAAREGGKGDERPEEEEADEGQHDDEEEEDDMIVRDDVTDATPPWFGPSSSESTGANGSDEGGTSSEAPRVRSFARLRADSLDILARSQGHNNAHQANKPEEADKETTSEGSDSTATTGGRTSNLRGWAKHRAVSQRYNTLEYLAKKYAAIKQETESGQPQQQQGETNENAKEETEEERRRRLRLQGRYSNDKENEDETGDENDEDEEEGDEETSAEAKLQKKREKRAKYRARLKEKRRASKYGIETEEQQQQQQQQSKLSEEDKQNQESKMRKKERKDVRRMEEAAAQAAQNLAARLERLKKDRPKKTEANQNENDDDEDEEEENMFSGATTEAGMRQRKEQLLTVVIPSEEKLYFKLKDDTTDSSCDELRSCIRSLELLMRMRTSLMDAESLSVGLGVRCLSSYSSSREPSLVFLELPNEGEGRNEIDLLRYILKEEEEKRTRTTQQQKQQTLPISVEVGDSICTFESYQDYWKQQREKLKAEEEAENRKNQQQPANDREARHKKWIKQRLDALRSTTDRVWDLSIELSWLLVQRYVKEEARLVTVKTTSDDAKRLLLAKAKVEEEEEEAHEESEAKQKEGTTTTITSRWIGYLLQHRPSSGAAK
ncbi:hypothetical protein QOT17_003945 [Balamuthia mandrillaris]